VSFLGPDTVTILVSAAFATAVLGAGGMLTEIGPWYAQLRKPSWQPPNWLFAPAWTLIAILTVVAAVLAWDAAPDAAGRAEIIALFVINGALNMAWSLLFFKMHRPDWALIEVVLLWLSIAALMVGLAPMSVRAGWLLLPYLLWVSFASVLNRKIVQLNQPFRRRAAMQTREELGS